MNSNKGYEINIISDEIKIGYNTRQIWRAVINKDNQVVAIKEHNSEISAETWAQQYIDKLGDQPVETPQFSWMSNYREDDPQTSGPAPRKPRRRLVEDEFGEIVEEIEVVDNSFEVIAQDSNYSEIPTGPRTESFDDFVKAWDLEIVDQNTVRAEWGNGEGYDTFTIRFS